MKRKQSNILVTGGCGFIGSFLVNSLIKLGYKVIVIDDLSSERKPFINNEVKFYKVDIYKSNLLEDVFKKEKIDTIIHLAAKHYMPYCQAHKKETIETNVIGTLNILVLMKKYGIKRLIFSSSASVYYPSNKPHKETDKVGSLDIYGASKILGEKIIGTLSPIFGIDYTALRLFNVYGPNDTTSHLIPEIIKQMKADKEVKLGNLKSRRDYIWVEDVVRAIVISLTKTNCKNQIFNVGTGKAWSVEQVFGILNNISGKRFELKSVKLRQRILDSSIIRADIKKINELTKWRPRVALRTGLCYCYIDH
ncbi:MAG: NAD-dependent epimerase/dehydratase family protein [bacterium]|nr:NAD-dependent epimerase/dehydratase family protein [bacterium]